MKNNKKGAELAIGTLVIIVLAIIVLVVIALGFGMGWSNLWSKITGYFSPVNVDSVKQACTYACTTKANYDYCSLNREVTYEDASKQKKTASGTCADLNAKVPGMNLQSCPDIPCTAGCKSTALKCEEINLAALESACKAKGCKYTPPTAANKNDQKCEQQTGATITTCNEITLESLCKKQLVTGGASKNCKFENNVCKAPETNTIVTACDNIELTGDDAAKKAVCETQQGCTYS